MCIHYCLRLYKCSIFAANYSALEVRFYLHRHFGYFLINFYVPCTLIVLLAWVALWINREATSDRIGLGKNVSIYSNHFFLPKCSMHSLIYDTVDYSRQSSVDDAIDNIKAELPLVCIQHITVDCSHFRHKIVFTIHK